MAVSLATMQSDRDRLFRAITQGARVVQFHDRIVTYRGVDEQTKALAILDGAIDDLENPTATPTPNQGRLVSSKGT